MLLLNRVLWSAWLSGWTLAALRQWSVARVPLQLPMLGMFGAVSSGQETGGEGVVLTGLCLLCWLLFLRDSFFTRAEFSQLLFAACTPWKPGEGL